MYDREALLAATDLSALADDNPHIRTFEVNIQISSV